ncbi:MAG: Hsp20/alpha crystallin family protein [Nitrososphaerales archaeon]
MKRGSRVDVRDDLSLAILLIGIVVIGLILMLIVRVQRGLLGLVLAGLTVVLLVYWLREFRRAVKKELIPETPSKRAEWTYELIEDEDEITILGEVPGPEDQVKVEIVDGKLEIKSVNFQKVVKLLQDVSIISKSYINGVLNVRLRKQKSLHRENVEEV